MGTGSWVRGNSSLDSGGGKRDGRKQPHVATEHLKCSGVKDVVQKKKKIVKYLTIYLDYLLR